MMKKILFFVSCFFMMINTTWAITLVCPEKVSPGEVIDIKLEEENVTGIKGNFDFDDGFFYQNIDLNFPWKSYYDSVNGFSVGNVLNKDKLIMNIGIKVGMDVSVNTDYTFGIKNIMVSDNDYQTNVLEDISCDVKVLSNIDTLDSLEIEGVTLEPEFDENKTSYYVEVDKDKIVIRAIASDKDAKLEGDLGEKELNYGTNTFVIKVISVRGNTKEYYLYVTRPLKEEEKKEEKPKEDENEVVSEVKKSNDITLKSLTIKEGKIDFKKDKFLYEITVENKIEKINVEAIANSDKAKVEIQNIEKLNVGENSIKIIVIAEDGTVGTYIIIVNRKEKLSSDATIKNLTVRGYKLDFKPDLYEYNLKIETEDKLDIIVELNSDKAKYTIKGNKNLKNNSEIDIMVIAEDNSKNVYKINIIKEEVNNSNKIVIKLIPIICFVVLIGIVLFVKLLKDKNKDNLN